MSEDWKPNTLGIRRHLLDSIEKDCPTKRFRCDRCMNWELTNPELRFGSCKARGITTEGCSGIRTITPSKINICHHFHQVEKPTVL
jgi:hypothetical protein